MLDINNHHVTHEASEPTAPSVAYALEDKRSWFRLTIHRDAARATLARILAFTSIDQPDGLRVVLALGTDGRPFPISTEAAAYNVKGNDLSPNGRQWKDVFAATRPTGVMTCDVTDECQTLLAGTGTEVASV